MSVPVVYENLRTKLQFTSLKAAAVAPLSRARQPSLHWVQVMTYSKPPLCVLRSVPSFICPLLRWMCRFFPEGAASCDA